MVKRDKQTKLNSKTQKNFDKKKKGNENYNDK